MPFTPSGFSPLSGSANSDASKIFQYKEDSTLTPLLAANYFNEAAASYGLKEADVILLMATDGIAYFNVAVSAGDVSLNRGIISAV